MAIPPYRTILTRIKRLPVLAHPVIWFIVLSSICGLVIIFRMAPLGGTDEFTHFPRVYQITDGTYWERPLANQQYGGYLPNHVVAMINDYRDLSRKPTGNLYQARKAQLATLYGRAHAAGTISRPSIFTSIVVYPPWAYLPSAIGLSIAKALHASLLWYVYAARLSTLALYIALCALAIRALPSGKWFMVTVALLPTALSQAATIGADGLLNGLCWLVIALSFRLAASSTPIRVRQLALLTVISVYICLIKDGYWLIAAVPLVIPNARYASVRNAWLLRASYAILLFVPSTLFALRTSHVAATTVLTPRLGVTINSHAQMNFLVHHLGTFLRAALIQPFTKNFDTIYLGVVGIITNRLIYLSVLIIGVLYFGLYRSLIVTQKVLSLAVHRLWLRSLSAVVIIGTYLLLCVAFYLGNTAVGATTIFGIYGRYFLPLLPLLLVWPMTRRRVSSFPSNIGTILPSLLGLAATILSIGS